MASISGEFCSRSRLADKVKYTDSNQVVPGIYNDPDSEKMFAVRAPETRPPAHRSTEGLLTGDVIYLVDGMKAEAREESEAMGNRRLHGVEGEANVIDTEGDPANIYDENNKPIIEDMAPELYKGMIETDVGPDEDIVKLYHHDLPKQLTHIALTLSDRGMYIDPASARMQDIPTEDDLAPNEYIRSNRLVFGPKLEKFIAAGTHEHHDLDINHSPVVSRYIRPLMPMMNLGLLAAPHAFGELTPNLQDHLEEYAPTNDLRAYDGVQPHSVRYPIRWSTSTDGGVGRQRVHDDLDDLREDIDAQLKEGVINHPARTLGSHADIRIRVDPPTSDTSHPGRLEICGKDTGVYRHETLGAYGELSDAVVKSLEKVAAGGKKNIKKLHAEFPTLFGEKYDKHTYQDIQLERAHKNSLEVAYYGNDARIIDATGNEVKVQAHMKELLRFVKVSGFDLSPESHIEITKSLAKTDEITKTMKKFRDETGAPSLDGYYQTGLGNPAAWMIERAKVNQEINHLNEKDTMRDSTLNRAKAFRRHLGISAISKQVTL